MKGVHWMLAITLWHVPIVLCVKPKPVYQELSMFRLGVPSELNLNETSFGYSISYESQSQKLIVGAPTAQYNGRVFSCNLTSAVCSVVNNEKMIMQRYKRRFGATVAAGASYFMTCAPRIFMRKDNGKEYRSDTFARCYVSSDDGPLISVPPISQQEISKDVTLHHGNEKKIELFTTTFGWSMNIADDDTVLIGGPAMSTGRVMAYKRNDPAKSYLIKLDNAALAVHNASVKFNFGYSIASGRFIEGAATYAIGSPYGDMGKGKILFFDEHGSFLDAIIDDDVGNQFGGSLCFATLDVGIALLVGAPAFVPNNAGSDTSQRYDVGAVHIYSREGGTIVRKQTITGLTDAGQFGSAIISIGDLNGDGNDEVAISAPYEDEGVGAVYIYSGVELLGNAMGSEVPWLQRIQTHNPPGSRLGYSLASLPDYDDNGCNELAIGEPGIESVLILRCMALVTITVNANFPDIKKNPGLLSISGDQMTFEFTTCFNVSYPVKPKLIWNNVSVEIEIDHPSFTLENANDNGTFVYFGSLHDRLPAYCKAVKVVLTKGGDFDQPIVLKIKATLLTDLVHNFGNLVTLSDQSKMTLRGEVALPGSKLSLSYSSTFYDGYQIGSTESENITLIVSNAGNTAYVARVRVRIDPISAARVPASCARDGRLVACSLPTPLANKQQWNVTITLDTKALSNLDESVVMHAELLNKRGEWIQTRDVTIVLKTDFNVISLKGTSYPSKSINVTRDGLASGQTIEHVYEIFNRGYSSWRDLECIITQSADVNLTVNENCTNVSGASYFYCKIRRVPGNDKKDIIMTLVIPPGTPLMASMIESGKRAAVKTHFECHLSHVDIQNKNRTKSESITTEFELLEFLVPLWIIIVSALIGLVMVLLVACALYQCGYLDRNNKKLLMELKEDVKRHSIRQSMKLRDSMVEAATKQHADKQQLLGHDKSNDQSGGTAVTDTLDPFPFGERDLDVVIKTNKVHES